MKQPDASFQTPPTSEAYTQRDNPAFEATLTARTAEEQAAFFLPHLHRGMRVLDVGCGPGSITAGLAEHVAPGEVVGIDGQPAQVEQARAAATQRGLINVSFQVGDAYHLPFSDRWFDAAFAHGVLMHLREPVRALAEVRRVLRPGGVVGLRDPDLRANIIAPMTPVREQYVALRDRVQRHNGGDPEFARNHRRALLDAGFTRAEAGASVTSAGSTEGCRATARFMMAQLVGFGRTGLSEGWADQTTLDTIAADIIQWAERPDAFWAFVWCETVGWNG